MNAPVSAETVYRLASVTKPFTPEEIASNVGRMPLNFAPGSQVLYSNTGYLVLGLIVEKVSGKSYGGFLAGRVFEPLGMSRTRLNSPDDIIPNRAAGYVCVEGRLRNSPYFHPTLYDNADAGLISTVQDLARWDAALTTSEHDNKSYALNGPEALAFAEMAHRLSRAVSRTITFVDVPPEAMRAALAGLGFPEWQADGLLEEFAMYRRGEAAGVEAGVREALGRAPRSFEEFARDYAQSFA